MTVSYKCSHYTRWVFGLVWKSIRCNVNNARGNRSWLYQTGPYRQYSFQKQPSLEFKRVIARFRFNREPFFAIAHSHEDWSVAQKLCDMEYINFEISAWEMMVNCESFKHIDAWFTGCMPRMIRIYSSISCTREHSYFRDLLIMYFVFLELFSSKE